jgi:Ca2+-binding RTX toxin-like protein
VRIQVRNGDDSVQLGPGPSHVRLDAGGGPGSDLLQSGDVRSTLFGDGGDDRLFGGAGRDSLHGAGGANFMDPGPGPDSVVPTSDRDEVHARDGEPDQIECNGAGGTILVDPIDEVFQCPNAVVG